MAVVIKKKKQSTGFFPGGIEIGVGVSVGLMPTSVLSVSVRDGVPDS